MDTGFDLGSGGDDRPVGVDGPGPQSRARDKTADRAIIVVTLCSVLIIATVGIVYLMATGRNVNKEVTLAVAVGYYKLAELVK